MGEKETLGRPDLEEFLSALSGFVDKRSASPDDSSYLKFLDIFCRSVGSTEGHLLRPDADSRLESLSSFGVDEKFDADFNASRTGGASPLESAFTEQRVGAIVEITSSNVPAWFFSLMERYGYKSLVAVPIVGPSGTTGLLCAYYRDVCLFDQGTLDRLATVGRMLGGTESQGAEQKPAVRGNGAAQSHVEKAETGDDGDAVADVFAITLTEKPFTKIQVFTHVVSTVSRAMAGSSVICGPVRIVSGDMTLTIADAEGVPSSAVSQRVVLPKALRERLSSGEGNGLLSAREQGELKSIIKSPSAAVLCRSVRWQGKTQAAVIAWRAGTNLFNGTDDRRMGRIAAIAALALNAV